jgi:hypothetical protein
LGVFTPDLGPGVGVAWILRWVQTGAEGEDPGTDLMEISRPNGLGDIANLGLTLSEAKQLLANVLREIAAAQARDYVVRRPDCPRCDGVCHMKDYWDHAVAALFGQVTMKLPRFRCAKRGGIETGISWPSQCRATPELDRLRAHLSALMTYRVAADLLGQMFPLNSGTDPETLRRHTLRVGEAFVDRAAIRPETSAPAITATLDSTFIRNCEDGERHLEVRLGNVGTNSGARQVFGTVAKTDTDIKEMIRWSLDAIGRSEGAELTAFTDGCPGLRRVLADAGVAETPILDWFHIGMRLEHLKQIAGALTTGNPARVAAKAVIVTEVERLRWRIWNGKAKNAQKSIIRIRAVCIISGASRVAESPSRRHEDCGPSCMLWMAI